MKKKVIGLIAILAVVGIFFILSWVFFSEKFDEKKIEDVKGYTIGEDVTLYEGVQAFFGDDGTWWLNDDMVYLNATTEKHVLKMSFKWMGEMIIIEQFYYDYFDLTEPERQELLARMVQAAKRKR